jgi:hypothetical protein
VSFELQFTSAYSAQSGYSVNLAFSNARRVNAFAITQLAFGVPTVTPAIHPSGINDEAFGSTVASADAWIVNNTGFTQLAFGTASITMYVLETGFNTYSPGSTTVSGLNTIAPSGIASAEAFGTPELRDVTVADVALFVATSYGTASLSRTLPTSSGIPAARVRPSRHRSVHALPAAGRLLHAGCVRLPARRRRQDRVPEPHATATELESTPLR